MKIFFFILLLSSFSLKAQVLTKEECSPVDIRSSLNPELKKHFSVPRNQDSTGWCYGFSASDLLSAHLGEPVSALHVSALYNRKARRNIFMRTAHEIGLAISEAETRFEEVYESGLCKMAIGEAMRNGKVCHEKDLPFDYKYQDSTKEMIKDLEKIRKDRKKLSKDAICNQIEEKLEFHGLTLDSSSISEELVSRNMNLGIESIANEQCKKNPMVVSPLKIKSLSLPGKSLEKRKHFLQEIGDLFKKGKPIEISYNVNKYVNYMDGLHSSVVVARRWHNNRCQYKIRNSWGKDCSLYKSNVDCEKETGSYWVNDEDFVKNTNSTTYLE